MRGWRKRQQLRGLPNSQQQDEEGSRVLLAVHIVLMLPSVEFVTWSSIPIGCNWDGRCRRRAAVDAVTGFEVKEHGGAMSPTRKCRVWLRSPRGNPICLVIRSVLLEPQHYPIGDIVPRCYLGPKHIKIRSAHLFIMFPATPLSLPI